MPLLNANKRVLAEEGKGDTSQTSKRSRLDSENLLSESCACDIMTDPQKKANFSALSGNGINRHASSLSNSKPGVAKKLTIKNFKGRYLLLLLLPSIAQCDECHHVYVRRLWRLPEKRLKRKDLFLL